MDAWPQRFLLAHRVAVAEVLSECHPLSPALLCDDRRLWDWERVAVNEAIAWDAALIEDLSDRLPGQALASNAALPWSAGLIRSGVEAERWTWSALTRQPRVFEAPELLALCLPHWGAGLRRARGVRWGEEAELWAPALVAATPSLDWSALCSLEHFPWSLAFLRQHADRLDWAQLSANPGLPWSPELLRAFAGRWDWPALSACEGVPWTPELIAELEPRLSWEALLNHPRLRWTQASYEQLAPLAHAALGARWERACKAANWGAALISARLAAEEHALSFMYLCSFARGLWTPAFIEQHASKLGTAELGALAANPDVPWGEAGLLERWSSRFEHATWYALSCNLGFAPTREQLQRHREHWRWEEQSSRVSVAQALAWSELPWHWEQVIHADREALCARLELSDVEIFVAARVRTRAEPREPGLEAAIVREFEASAPYEVYADWLEERGDPHAELIRAMLGEAAPDLRRASAARMRYIDHVELDISDTRWARGFILATKLWRDWRGHLGLRVLRFVEELELFALPESPVSVEAVGVLAQLDRLRHLALRQLEPEALARLPALEGLHSLALRESELDTLAPVCELAKLELLYLADVPLTQLDSLALAPSLRVLRLRGLEMTTLDSLAGLQGLEELTLTWMELEDSLAALLELPRLRQLSISNVELSEGTLADFRRARPEVSLEYVAHRSVRHAGGISLWQL